MRRDHDVVVLCGDAPTENDRRARAIAEFMGASAEFATLHSGWNEVPTCSCLIVAADTITGGGGANGPEVSTLITHASQVANHVVIYGLQSTDAHRTMLRALSSNELTDIQPLPDLATTFSVAEGYRPLCGTLAGLSLGRVDVSRDQGFIVGNGSPQLEVLIQAGNVPSLARTPLNSGHVYFVGCREFADLDEPVYRSSNVLDWFSRLVPMMMILRGALGDRVWRNESPRACFIIDDPLLTRRYGFLEYQRLVETMRPHRFFPCIAFIPWNYERSRKDVAALLSSEYGAPFLCVHGCDHTRAEFATTDMRTLESKAHLALERMRQQARISGVPFDDVMVFPQGLFSGEAISALNACSYLAAVNSDVCPSTSSSATLALRDLLDVAVTKFADFPLFSRRYPRDVAAPAFDLFLGKPALLVEHHGYFRSGYAALASFVERLNALEPRLEWSSLGSVCSKAALERTTDDEEARIRFFTARFSLSNDGSRTQSYVLTRPHTTNGPLPPVVKVNDRDWPSEVIGGQLTVRLTLEPGETAGVRVSSPAEHAPRPVASGPRYAAKVRIRRYLSEFRDNYVDTSPVLHSVMSAARTVRRDVKVQVAAARVVNMM